MIIFNMKYALVKSKARPFLFNKVVQKIQAKINEIS